MELEAAAARLREIDLDAADAAREAKASRERCFWEIQGRESQGEAADPGSVALAAKGTLRPGFFAGSEGGEDRNPADRRGEAWRAAEYSWKMAVLRKGGCEELRPLQQGRVDRAQGEFLADRRDRLQAQTLVEEAAGRERAEQARREQRGLDDWFQSQAKRSRDEEKA